MKLVAEDGRLVLELTRRNLEVLLDKLDLEGSARTLGCGRFENTPAIPIYVRSVENEEHYSEGPPPGDMLTTQGLI